MTPERTAVSPAFASSAKNPDGPSIARRRIELALAAIGGLRQHAATIDRIAERVAERLARGGTLYTAGNGGSAAEALHLAEELVGRYRSNRPPLRAVALVADPTALTCIANDFGFDEVFARPCEAFLGPNDILVLFTTSGRSQNLVKAAQVGRRKGSLVIGLLGGDGGATLPQCDEAILVAGPAGPAGAEASRESGGEIGRAIGRDASPASISSLDSAAIQEAHQVILHAICERLEPQGDARPTTTTPTP